MSHFLPRSTVQLPHVDANEALTRPSMARLIAKAGAKSRRDRIQFPAMSGRKRATNSAHALANLQLRRLLVRVRLAPTQLANLNQKATTLSLLFQERKERVVAKMLLKQPTRPSLRSQNGDPIT